MDKFFDFIQNVGFPIACCAFLIYDSVQREKAQEKLLKEMKESIECMKDAIQELTFYIKGEH